MRNGIRIGIIPCACAKSPGPILSLLTTGDSDTAVVASSLSNLSITIAIWPLRRRRGFPPSRRGCRDPAFGQMYPPKPTFTGKNVPDLSPRCTSSPAPRRVSARRSPDPLLQKCQGQHGSPLGGQTKRSIAYIQKAWRQSKGSLIFLHLDLAGLSTIKPAVKRLTARKTSSMFSSKTPPSKH